MDARGKLLRSPWRFKIKNCFYRADGFDMRRNKNGFAQMEKYIRLKCYILFRFNLLSKGLLVKES